MPQLEYVLNGIKCVQARQAPQPQGRLPITTETLKARSISTHPDPNNVMFWAAANVFLKVYLRAGEFTSPLAAAFDPEVHLCLSNMVLDSHVSPKMVRLHVKQNKTDPLHLGIDVFLGATGTDTCLCKPCSSTLL